MTDQLLRFKNYQKFLIIDYESEGLNLRNSRPWEVGYILCQGKNTILENKSQIWWPDLQISEEAARITRFDRFSYERDARDPKEVWAEFEKLFYDPCVLIVGQNILNFDGFITNVWRRNIGLPTDWSFINRVIDTRALSVAIQKGNKTVDHNDLLCWQMRFMHHRERGLKATLESMVKHYGFPYDRNLHHDSLNDCRYTRDVFQKMIYEIEI